MNYTAPKDNGTLSALDLAIRQGKWERFEHPEKGPTLTLFLGNVHMLSIHNNLLCGEPSGTESIRALMGKMHREWIVPELLIQLSRTRAEYEAAIRVIKELTGEQAPDSLNLEPSEVDA